MSDNDKKNALLRQHQFLLGQRKKLHQRLQEVQIRINNCNNAIRLTEALIFEIEETDS
jgi:primosomal protein N''